MAAVRKGVITFGLVSVPVELHVAARPKTVSFNQLHDVCKTRIKEKLYCPTCEREVERSEIVKGYRQNGYVVMDDEDFARAEQASSRAIEVLEFVEAAQVDPLYFERSFYVGPQEESERAYQVLVRALTESGKAAVVRFVMGTRQYHALLRPAGETLVLHTLYYADEVRGLEADWKSVKPTADEVKLAVKLIDALAADFQPEKYRDEYRATLTELIRAKAEGTEIEVPKERREPGKVVNLMDALQRSVEQVRKPLSKAEPAGRGTSRARARRGRRAAPARLPRSGSASL